MGGLQVETPDYMRDISITNSKLTLSLSFLRDWRADGLPTALNNGHKYLLKPQACNNWCQCLLGVKQIDNKNKKENKLSYAFQQNKKHYRQQLAREIAFVTTQK